MEKVANYSKSLTEHGGIAAVGKMLAAMIHYENVVYQESLKRTSVLDSGAARHVHPDVIITDMENRTKLSSFSGPSRVRTYGPMGLVTSHASSMMT